MKAHLKAPFLLLFFALLLVSSTSHADQIRVVSWNSAGGAREGTATILEAIGEFDVLALQEQSAGDTSSIVALLDDRYTSVSTPPGAQTNGAGLPGLIFNSQTIELIDAIAFGEVSGNSQARSTLRYELQPIRYLDDARFFLYNNHYKAGTGTSNVARRNVEATTLRNDLDALGDGVNAVLLGDFNIRSSAEAMFVSLTEFGPGQVFDPIQELGHWSGREDFKHVHTQSPSTVSNFGGQATGGMDDRFDFQLVSGELLDDVGLDYVPGSYQVFGNNGTHTLDRAITTGTAESPEVLEALAKASDHLPVVVDYRLPRYEDCNADEKIDVLDANCTTQEALPAFLTDTRLTLGDANGDGEVSFHDFLLVWHSFNSRGQYTDGDFDKDGTIGLSDFAILARNYGEAANPVFAASVPEPTLTALLPFYLLLFRRGIGVRATRSSVPKCSRQRHQALVRKSW